MSVRALYFNVLDIGKHVKKSKRRFTWKFSIDGKEHMVDLVVSYLSGKRKITHDSKLLYEGQKVLTTSFQFPFEIELNMCNIVQQGENFELRINNQSFSDLYKRGGRSDYNYENESRNSYGSDPRAVNHGNSYGGSGSKNTDSYRNSGASYGHKVNMNEAPSYEKTSNGWEDVRDAQRGARRDQRSSTYNQNNEDFGNKENENNMNQDFGNHNRYSQSNTSNSRPRAQTNVPRNGFSGFDDFGNQKQPQKKNTFDDFSTFDNFGASNQQKNNNNFSGFDGFNDFNKPQANMSNRAPETQKTQYNQQQSVDVLSLDFSDVNQQKNVDFFNQQQSSLTNQRSSQQGLNAQAGKNVNQPQVSSNDLFTLDFTGSENQTVQKQGSILIPDQSQYEAQNQTKAQASKGNLWDSELVSLDSSEVRGQNSQYVNQNNKTYGYGAGPLNNQGYGNFNQGIGYNQNNMGFNGYQGGPSNNSTGGYVGMNPGYGGSVNGVVGYPNNTTGPYNQGTNGGYFQQQQQNMFVGQTNVEATTTPFDDLI